ncbi:MAG: helix-turn-helix domain-containing protein [Deltaproteobacteria bacterium]|nr:helix-turn-helix domain-containing protein [Deltaproteobacteria bacterium]MCB9788646.1 helix-turn-helix domain-containing protein [Deltaproteobacteria bacterium]
MNPVLTEAELAELLRITPALVSRLLAESDLPRLSIAGQRRFLTEQVLGWLATRSAPLLAPGPETAERAKPAPEGPLPAADDTEGPFVSTEALAGLGADPPRPEDNLARSQARDGLIALADALLPALGRASKGRLQPAGDEAERTSAWRAEDAGGAPITSLVFTFVDEAVAAGAPVEGEPRLELTLERHGVSLALLVPEGAQVPQTQVLDAARRDGAEIAPPQPGRPLVLARRHAFAARPPTLRATVAVLEADARELVPLWRAAVGERVAEGV